MIPILVLIADIVLDFNASVETAVLIDDVIFTPLHLPHAVSLFAMSGVVFMENASSCCLVLFGTDFKPVLSTNVHTARYCIHSFLCINSHIANSVDKITCMCLKDNCNALK